MRIFVLGTRGFPNIQGGVEKHCEELYPRIVSLGADVLVFARSHYFDKKIQYGMELNFVIYGAQEKKVLKLSYIRFLLQ